MDLKTAIRLAAKGDAIAFTGAGFSFGAKNLENKLFASGNKLAERISADLGLPADTPLTLAAEIFREQRGTDPLIELIKPAFTAAVPVPDAAAIVASLPWACH
jgi:hypothetical protein